MFRAALDGLSGIPEWKFSVWSQAEIDKRWHAIGGELPAPLLPKSMEGARIAPAHGHHVLYPPGSKKPRGVTREENDFWNYIMKVGSDPFRKSSGISKVAGGLLQVASAAIPAFGYFQAVATAGNMALDAGKPKADAALASRVMAPALAQVAAADKAQFDAQISKIQALAPNMPSAAQTAQNNFAAIKITPNALTIQPVGVQPAPPKSDVSLYLLMAGFALAAYLVVRR